MWILLVATSLGGSQLQAERQPLHPSATAKEQQDKVRTAMVNFPVRLHLSPADVSSLSRAERWALAYAAMDTRYKLPQGHCEVEVPALARKILAESAGGNGMVHLSALFVTGELAQAEDVALKNATSESVPAQRALYFQMAAACAVEQGSMERALEHIQSAVGKTDRRTDFETWIMVRGFQSRLFKRSGDLKQYVQAVHELHIQHTIKYGAEDIKTLAWHQILARTFAEMGMNTEAEEELRALYRIGTKKWGAEAPQTQETAQQLAKVLAAQGRVAEAASMANRAAPKMDTSGEDPESLGRRENLGLQLAQQRKFDEAIEQTRIVYHGRLRLDGPDARSTLVAQNNLGIMLYEQGIFEEAVNLLREVVAARERLLPDNDLETIASRNNLGNALAKAGQPAEAVKHHRIVADVRTRVLGADHPKTIDAYNNLASELAETGHLDEGLKMAREVVAARQRVLGPEDMGTLTGRLVLSTLLNRNRQHEEAVTEDRTTLAIASRVLGENHPQTLMVRLSLAQGLYNSGNQEEAAQICRPLREVALRNLGEDSPLVRSCDHLLRNLQLRQHNGGAQGVADARLSLERQLKALGPDHDEVLKSRTALAGLLHQSGQNTQAVKEYEALLADYKRLNKWQTREGLGLRSSYAEHLRTRGRLKESEESQRTILDEATSLLGNEEAFRLQCLSNLALNLATQERNEEAVNMFQSLLEVRTRLNGPHHDTVVYTLFQLSRCLQSLHRDDEAKKYAQQAYDIHLQTKGENDPATQVARDLLEGKMPSASQHLAEKQLNTENFDDLESRETALRKRPGTPATAPISAPSRPSTPEEASALPLTDKEDASRTPVFMRDDISTFDQLKSQLKPPAR